MKLETRHVLYLLCSLLPLWYLWEQIWLVMGATYYVPQWEKKNPFFRILFGGVGLDPPSHTWHWWKTRSQYSRPCLGLVKIKTQLHVFGCNGCRCQKSGFSLDKWLIKCRNWDCISPFWFWNVPTVTNTLCLQHQRHLSHGYVTAYRFVWQLVFFSELSVRQKRAVDWMSARMIPWKSVIVGNCHWACTF